MLKHLNFLDDHEMVIVGSHAQHHAVLHIQGDLARIPVFSAQAIAHLLKGLINRKQEICTEAFTARSGMSGVGCWWWHLPSVCNLLPCYAKTEADGPHRDR